LLVQEAIVDDWPEGVRDLYETIRRVPPSVADLDGALAVWLGGEVPVVAFNGA
jgi:hypothetical protein